ncbi:Carbamoyl dehydratase HypE [Moorella humiferrea]|uniref:hydrogenase expression/formation protein HypE n=1 Tax=Neomoorella humiferrea TaxID=676965 RepID=UPI0030CED624
MKENGRDIVLLAHGDGGALTHELINNLFLRYFESNILKTLTDAAVFSVNEGRIAITTDSFVVDPPFFPGGDVGKLAVCGTVNDLAVSGARPVYLTASFILEEGLPLADLESIVQSMAGACGVAGVEIVTGDTKVVEKGHLDKIFINTTGVGYIFPGVDLGYHRIKPGDKVLVNGNLGQHGIAVLCKRYGFDFAGQVMSDCAPLNGIISLLLKEIRGIKIMRDLTRGGLATTAKEIASACCLDIWLDENCIPVDAGVKGAAEMLGLDPLYLANEGKFMVIVSPEEAEKAAAVMQGHELGRDARIIGEVKPGKGNVYLSTSLGGTKFLDLLAGRPLPRIC